MGKNQNGNELRTLNAKLIPYNIIIAVIAIACVISLYVGTFWKISVNYQVSEDMMQSLLKSSGSGSENNFFDNVDFEDIASQAKFEMSLSLSPALLLTSLQGDNKVTVTNALNDASKEILGNVNTIIKNIIKAGAKLAVNMALNEVNKTIEDNLDQLPPEAANIDLSGINDIVDEMLSENPDNNKVKGDLVALTNEQIDNNPNLTSEQKAELKLESTQKVSEFYDNIITEYGDENGSVVPANIVMSVVGDSLGIDVEGETDIDNISLKISQNIVASMGESTITSIAIVIKGFGIFLVVVMAAWALLALSAILKIFTRNKRVSLKLARLLGWMPYIILVGIPMGIILLLPKAFATSSLSQYQDTFEKYTKGLSLTFQSGTYISALGTVALMLINWFGYKSIKKQIKKLR